MDLKDASNRAKLEISEVISYRLAGLRVIEEEERPPEAASHRQEDAISAGSSPISPESDKIYLSQGESAEPELLLGGLPLRAFLTPQEGDAIVEGVEGFAQQKVNNSESCREKPKRFPKTLDILCLTLLIFFTSGAAFLMGKNYWLGKTPQTLAQDGVGAAKALIIRGQNGQAQAMISERDGMFWFELRDAAGKVKASISIAAGDEPKLSLYDKDHKKLGEWGSAEAKAPVVESADKAVAPPSVPENESVDKAVAPPSVSEGASAPEGVVPAAKYVGSKTSNKYHYPHCKWVKLIKPERLLTFSSVQEAKDNGNSVRCPTCMSPLSDSPVTVKEDGDSGSGPSTQQ